MKKLLLLLFLPASLWAYQTPHAATGKGTVTLVCNLYEVPGNFDSLHLYDMYGLAAKTLASTAKNEQGKYVFTIPAGTPRIYGIGFTDTNAGKVILGGESEVTLWGNGAFMEKARTNGSPANKGLETVYKKGEYFRNAEGDLLNAELKAEKDPKAIAAVQKQAQTLAREKQHFLDSLKTANPMLHLIACLYVHPDALAEKKKPADAIDFIGKNYFRYANLSDPGYNAIPDVYDAFRLYAERLLMSGADADRAAKLAQAQLDLLPAGKKIHRMALGGTITGFKENGPIYVQFANQYLNLYRDDPMGEIRRLDYDTKKASVFTAGMVAPDLAGPTPDGSTYSLSQLRGKVVLIDFWASWCGPCRREMPNVKANYEKYKDKGFDILGVSLDREAEAWKKAIEADGIPWHHISDLKGWQSEHAALYSVNSIPQTLLIDRDGRIIARNLRGEELSKKLEEIFGK